MRLGERLRPKSKQGPPRVYANLLHGGHIGRVVNLPGMTVHGRVVEIKHLKKDSGPLTTVLVLVNPGYNVTSTKRIVPVRPSQIVELVG